MALSIYANDHQLSVAAFCDLGNMADVDVADVLRYYREDSATTIVGLFLEAGGRTGALAEEIAKLALAKPVVAAWVGRTMEGSRASLAHLGLASGEREHAIRELAQWCFLAGTGHELLHVSKALAWQPVPRGRRTGILTASGGIGAELADLAVEHGLVVPEFSPALQLKLKEYLPAYAACGNPVDVTPIWKDYSRLYPQLIRSLVASEEIDLVIVTVIDVATGINDLIETLQDLAKDETIAAAGKPIYVHWNSPQADLGNMARLQKARWPCYQTSLEVIRVAGAIARHPGVRVPTCPVRSTRGKVREAEQSGLL
jgi:acetyltransferase